MASPLITTTELRDRLGTITVLDVRYRTGGPSGRSEFEAGHVPGAAYVDLDAELAGAPGERGRHPLPDPEAFVGAMRRAGVGERGPVVVYDNWGGRAAARAWWLLRHYGHPDVRVLDGGWPAWRQGGGAAETGPQRPREPGDLTGAPGAMPVVEAGGALDVPVLVDARAPERYRGEAEPVDPVAGHVPGAVNVPTAANLVPAQAERHGHFRPADDLVAAYEKALGAAYDRGGDAEVGVYCGSGVTAAHDVFALHLLGLEAALFAPSWSGWVADPQRPVETGG